MITTNELITTLDLLANQEIDKGIIAKALADTYNKSFESILDLINLQVLRGYTMNGQILRGVISVGDAKVNMPLDCMDNKYILRNN